MSLPLPITGEQLYEELRVAAAAAGISIQQFASPLFNEPNWKLEQLRIAKRPTSMTIARIRALVAGESIPANRLGKGRYLRDRRAFGLSRIEAEERGLPPSGRSLKESACLDHAAAEKARIEQLRQFTELAHLKRRPGQTIADCVREMRQAVRA